MSQDPISPEPKYLMSRHKDRLAYRYHMGEGPVVVWLSGFMSDMEGSKVKALNEWAGQKGYGFLAFDYYAHGRSDGEVQKARLSRWLEDATDVIEGLVEGPVVVVGSSMGAWVAALLVPILGARLKALGFVAPAPDFTTELMLPHLSAPEAAALAAGQGFWRDKTHPPFYFTPDFFEDAGQHLVLGSRIAFEGKAHILQGMQDEAVPWAHALKLIEALATQNIDLTLIKDGDHRLSRPQDIKRLIDMVEDLRRPT